MRPEAGAVGGKECGQPHAPRDIRVVERLSQPIDRTGRRQTTYDGERNG